MSDSVSMTPVLPPIPVSVFGSVSEKMVAVYRVQLTMTDKLVGGIPSSEDSMAGWIRTKMGVTKEDEIQRIMLGHLKDLTSDPENPIVDGALVPFDDVKSTSDRLAKEMNGTRFNRDANGLVIESRIAAAMLRESVSILFPYHADGDVGRWGPTKKAANGLFREMVSISPSVIPIMVRQDDGSLVQAKNPEMFLFTGHVQKRSMLSMHEYVEHAVVSFDINVVLDAVPQNAWPYIMVQAEQGGLGAKRSQQHGKFKTTAWEKVHGSTEILLSDILSPEQLAVAERKKKDAAKASKPKKGDPLSVFGDEITTPTPEEEAILAEDALRLGRRIKPRQGVTV